MSATNNMELGLQPERIKSEKQHATPSLEKAKLRSVALLTIFSVFLLVEGVVRVIGVGNTDAGRWDGDRQAFPPVVLLIGAVLEVLFSSLGLYVGLAALLFDYEDPTLTLVLMFTQLAGGWFTFVVYTIAEPAFTEARARGPLAGLSEEASAVATAFGTVLASVAYCAVMQGAQFYFARRLHLFQTSNNFEHHLGFKGRLVGYSTLVLLGGIGITVVGSIINDEYGNKEYAGPFVYPPNIIKWSALTIVSGTLEIVYGLFGFVVVVSPNLVPFYHKYAVLVWLWLCSAHILGQLSLVGGAVGFAGAQIICLSTSLILAPAYFAQGVWEEAAHTGTGF